jgi:hypothetical protein
MPQDVDLLADCGTHKLYTTCNIRLRPGFEVSDHHDFHDQS